MIPKNELEIDISGLTPKIKKELEERVEDFERNYEPQVAAGGAGYVPKIRKGDYIAASIINGAILLYYIIAVLF